MTRERLGRFQALRAEIRDLVERIEAVRRAMEPAPTGFNGKRRSPTPTDMIGMLGPKLVDLCDMYERQRQAAVREFNAIAEWILTIDDPYLRRIFRYRYEDDLSWVQVAWKLQGCTPDGARMLHNRYLAKQNTGRGAGPEGRRTQCP